MNTVSFFGDPTFELVSDGLLRNKFVFTYLFSMSNYYDVGGLILERFLNCV